MKLKKLLKRWTPKDQKILVGAVLFVMLSGVSVWASGTVNIPSSDITEYQTGVACTATDDQCNSVQNPYGVQLVPDENITSLGLQPPVIRQGTSRWKIENISGNNYYLPFKTTTEWQAFRSRAETDPTFGVNLTLVDLVDCLTDGDCSGGQVCTGTSATPNYTCCTPESNSAFCSRMGVSCGPASGTDNCGDFRSTTCGSSCPALSDDCYSDTVKRSYTPSCGGSCTYSETLTNCTGATPNCNNGVCSACNDNPDCAGQANECVTSTQKRIFSGTCSGGNCSYSVQSCPVGYTCNTGDCYVWVTGSWSGCNIECGGTGTDTRTVTCQKEGGGTVADSFCDPLSKPATTQSCSPSCSGGETCLVNNTCCTPNCTGTCGGSDGCGGICTGSCGSGDRCCSDTCYDIADLDLDGDEDASDIQVMKDGIGGSPSTSCGTADVNDDGTVDFDDFFDFSDNYNGPSAPCSVGCSNMNPGSGVVGLIDYLDFLGCFGQSGTGACDDADYDNSGTVAIMDFYCFASDFGEPVTCNFTDGMSCSSNGQCLGNFCDGGTCCTAIYHNTCDSTNGCGMTRTVESGYNSCDLDSDAKCGTESGCDGVDNDCDGVIDDGTGGTYYEDSDGDGYGDSGSTVQACAQPTGYVTNSTDCDDSNSFINPGATEVCDLVDNDCDGSTDEGVKTKYYLDQDGDGYGVTSPYLWACSLPSGHSANSTDCNDSASDVNPGETEICDSTDHDCDGAKHLGVSGFALTTTSGCDQDGYCSGAYKTCSSSGSWGACSKTPQTEVCGDGINNDCDGATDETCTFSWESGNWGNCSNSCGSGTKTRSVWCERSDGASVSDQACSGTKPSTSTGCSSTSGCTYSWQTGSYGGCSNSCGSGTKTRSVWCERSDGATVSDQACSGTKPSTSTNCSSTSGCTYSWITGSYGNCSNSCGIGTKTRSVSCQRSDGLGVGDSNCSGSKPATSTNCSDYGSCTYSWKSGSWGTCSATCGGGTQTRSVWCERSDGTTVSSGCSGQPPTGTQGCNTHSCCTCSSHSDCGSSSCSGVYACKRYYNPSCNGCTCTGGTVYENSSACASSGKICNGYCTSGTCVE